MSAIQELSPFLSQFTERIRQAKDEQHLTIDAIVEKSGVSISNVTKIVSGSQTDPRLSNAAAICQALNLSLDEVTGIVPPMQSSEELVQRVRDLELENAELRGIDKTRLESMASQRPILIGAVASFVLSILTTFALAAYLIGDAMHVNVGLIKYGELSAPAWAAVILIVAALGNAALLAYRLYRYKKK